MKLKRKELGMNAEQVAQLLGVSPATVYRYEKGDIEKVPGDILEPLSKILQTTPAWLMGWDMPSNTLSIDDIYPKNHNGFIKVPILGRVAAGVPITAQEDIIGWEDVPADWVCPVCGLSKDAFEEE